MKLPLYSAAHAKVGDLEVAGDVFGRDGDNSLLHEAVRMQLANRRRGNASTKTKGFISGGGKKPWRQKGTGRARAGSTRSPLWRHGGTIFGPQPRDYSYKMPKKAWRARAMPRAFGSREERQAGSRRVAGAGGAEDQGGGACLAALGVSHALILVGEEDANFFRAARNLATHKVLPIVGLNVYDVLNYEEIVMTTRRQGHRSAADRRGESRSGGITR